MIRALPLALRYLWAHPLGALIRVACVAITLALPLVVHVLVDHYAHLLTARAEVTPLVLGAPGSRHDLIMTTLYFRPTPVPPITQGAAMQIQETDRGLVIPLHTRFTARGWPVVGTTPDYFSFRALKPAQGRLPLIIGEAVVGARVAEDLKLAPGGTVISDQKSLYNLAATYPLKMKVVGVLPPTGSADDEAVFVDVKTAWIIEGLAHGHQDVSDEAAPGETNVKANPGLVEFQEVTPENMHTFHMHGDPEGFPLTAALVVPHSPRDRTVLTAQVNADTEGPQLVAPAAVIEEILAVVFKVKRFLDLHGLVVAISTALLLALVVVLGLRLRRPEMQTLKLMGASRGVIFWVNAWEWIGVFVFGATIALLLTWGALEWAPALVGL
ncbi:MAG: ABC transporter permease [Bradymonadia bacterium]